MSSYSYYPLFSEPGIKLDGTNFEGKNYTLGQHCRFYRGYPRKIGGYKLLVGDLPNIPRGLYTFPQTPDFNIYIGDESTLKVQTIDSNGNLIGGLSNLTPVDFVADPNNVWTFDSMYSTISNSNILIAHAAPNLFSISNNVESPVYYGTIGSNTPLIDTGNRVSGGIVVLHPFLFMFGNAGDVKWTLANDPSTIMGEARVASQKIVAGLPTRGGNSSPAGLLWSLDSLIRVTQVGTTQVEFAFDSIASQSSLLSSRSIIEYDGLYFWAGTDRFLVYNGVVQEVPNDMNLNFFYLNLNYDQRQKVWATKIPQYGEIWWFFPMKGSDECNAAVIYNKRENKWYNTTADENGNYFGPHRGTGYFEQVFADPIWADNDPQVNNKYSIWWHEKGVDQNVNGILSSIPSFFQTGSIAWCAIDPSKNFKGVQRLVDLYSFEPDFIQSGDMTLTVKGTEYANSPVISSTPYSFNPSTLKIDLREQRREMYLRFDSNEVGGFYQLGQSLVLMRIGDVRP
jgi:hypothetical protein